MRIADGDKLAAAAIHRAGECLIQVAESRVEERRTDIRVVGRRLNQGISESQKFEFDLLTVPYSLIKVAQEMGLSLDKARAISLPFDKTTFQIRCTAENLFAILYAEKRTDGSIIVVPQTIAIEGTSYFYEPPEVFLSIGNQPREPGDFWAFDIGGAFLDYEEISAQSQAAKAAQLFTICLGLLASHDLVEHQGILRRAVNIDPRLPDTPDRRIIIRLKPEIIRRIEDSPGGERRMGVMPHWRRGHVRRLENGKIVPVSPCIVGAKPEHPERPKPRDYRIVGHAG